jgi:HEAT repeat protein/CheY-like chemotaxis protein
MTTGTGSPPPRGTGYSSARILVAEKDQAVRSALVGLLRRLGYQAIEAASVQTALAHLAHQPFDLVLLDLNFSSVDTTQILQTARRVTPSTVFIILTNYATLDSAIIALRHGAYSYLLKPSPEQEITRAIRAGLARRHELMRHQEHYVQPQQRAPEPKPPQPAKPSGLEEFAEEIDITADDLWNLVNYLAGATGAFEARLFRLVTEVDKQPVEPYKSLYSYEIEDADLFFGRKAVSDTLCTKVLADRLTVLHGESGGGKTSLLKAGLSPRLIREGRLPVFVQTDHDPATQIKRVIAPPSAEPWPTPLETLSLHQFLRLACDRLSRDSRELVLILDQFEQFLRFWPRWEYRQVFVEALAACYNDRSLPIRIIISLRKEHFSDLAQFETKIPKILDNQVWLPPLSKTDARDAVTRPLQLLPQPVSWEPALLDALLDDLDNGGPLVNLPEPLTSGFSGEFASEPSEGVEPPHLQIVCAQLYQTMEDDGIPFSLDAYEKLGRAEGILDGYAQSVIDQLSSESRPVAQQVLSELVSFQATPRRRGAESLARTLGVEIGELTEVLQRLVESRLLYAIEVGGDAQYELAHAYLIQEILPWIETSAWASKRAQELLAREMVTHQAHGSLLPRNRLRLLHGQRDRLVGLTDEALRFILRSALKSGFAIEDWAHVAGEAGEKLLLEGLNDPRDDVRRAVNSSLGALWGLDALSGLGDSRAGVRQTHIRSLGEQGDPRAVEPLIATLQDQNPPVRQAACEALGMLGERRALKPLLGALADGDRNVRQAAAWALGELGDEKAVQHLSGALRDDDTYVQRTAIRSLGKIWDLPALIKLGDEDRYVGWEGARELTDLADPRTVEPLITVLQDEHRSVRRAAAAALAKLGEAAAEALTISIRSQDWDVRQISAQVLGQIGDPRALQPLLLTLHDEHAEVRQAVVAALTGLGQVAVEPLTDHLRDADSDIRRRAARALGELGARRAVGPLIGVLRDANSQVRQAAREALVEIGEPAVEELIGALENRDHFVRRAVAEALGEIANTRAVDSLVATLEDTNSDVRRAAAAALAKLDDVRIVEPFIGALEDKDRYVRREVAFALGKRQDARAIEPLLAALQDSDRGVRQAASAALVKIGEPAIDPMGNALQTAPAGVRWAIAGVLSQMGDQRAMEPLVSLLNDEDRVVRRAAAAALGRLGDPRAVEPLIAALLDSESGVRWAATGSLGELADPRAADALIAALEDEDTSVRRAAAEALRKIGTPNALDALS